MKQFQLTNIKYTNGQREKNEYAFRTILFFKHGFVCDLPKTRSQCVIIMRSGCNDILKHYRNDFTNGLEWSETIRLLSGEFKWRVTVMHWPVHPDRSPQVFVFNWCQSVNEIISHSLKITIGVFVNEYRDRIQQTG